MIQQRSLRLLRRCTPALAFLLLPLISLAQLPAPGYSSDNSSGSPIPADQMPKQVITGGMTQRITLPEVPQPGDFAVIDRPGDDGSALLVTFTLAAPEGLPVSVGLEAQVDGQWLSCGELAHLEDVPMVADLPQYFGNSPGNPSHRCLVAGGVEIQDENGESNLTPLNAGQSYAMRVKVAAGDLDGIYSTAVFDAGNAETHEEWFKASIANVLVISLIFACIILTAIYRARRNPNLFIRRINGLEAVDDAIGRATEMGKPILHLNGLDPLTTLSTIAAVNILGRIAKRVADYDSQLMVPCFDPVVMTVSQETVRQAYMEAGRPDAYREDNIFFVTDQQFSYVASVCGIMLREKPAANFFLGYFYAESLLLAETGQSTGAIQIAGTDAQAQLPFFITTCDYTLIGEELYAASAYLSREPMLLGSLKGLDVVKAVLILMILLGSILATCQQDWLTRLVRVLQ